MVRLLFLLLLSVTLAAPVRAESPFTSALELWLADDTEAALRQLATLAASGDREAQILLGQIEPLSHTHSTVTATLSRHDRIALLKRPEGLSGTSWLKTAAMDSALAQTLWQGRDITHRRATIPALIAAGEVKAAYAALLQEMEFGTDQHFFTLMTDPLVLPLTRPRLTVALQMWAAAYGNRPALTPQQRAKAVALLGELDPPLSETDGLIDYPGAPSALLSGPAALRQTTAQTLFAASLMHPLALLCHDMCPDTAPACTLTLAVALSPNGPPLLHTLSPVESLLPTSTYRASPRFVGDILRLARRHPAHATLAQLDHCAAKAIEAAK